MAAFAPKRMLLTVWRIYLVGCALIPAFLISLFFRVMGKPWLIATGLWLAVFVFLYSFYFPRHYKRKSFSLEKDHISARGGVLYHYNHILPLQSIQYVTLMASPLDRLVHICSLVVVAPGGRMVLSGLGREEGKNLMSVLAEAALHRPESGA